MKLSDSVSIPRKQQASNFVPIPFKRFEYGELEKSDYETYTLRNVPDDPNSSTFRINVPYYRGGRGEEYILFKRNLEKVFIGQNVQDDATRFSIMRRLLQGAALATFNNKVEEYEEEVEGVFISGLIAVRNAAFPKRAVSKQKRYMRRHMHKSISCSFKNFLHRVQEMNGYFKEMPPNVPVEDGQEEIAPTGMPDDDLMDILEFACPAEWQKQMRLQDFDTSQKTFDDLVDFCKNLEELEELEQQQANKKKAGKKDGGKSKKRKSEFDKSDEKKYHCMLHGDNHSHDTADCTVLKSQAKKMRGMYKAQPSDRRAKYKQTQELQAIVATSVARAIKSIKKKKGKSTTKKSKKTSTDEFNAFENMSLSDDSDKSKSSEDDSESLSTGDSDSSNTKSDSD